MLRKLNFMLRAARLGPDMPLTHWMLHSRSLGRVLCKRKFRAFGEGSEFRPYAFALNTQNVSIGANVVIRPGTTLGGPIDSSECLTIEDDVLLAPNVYIVCDNHTFSNPEIAIAKQGNDKSEGVKIERGAWVGANAIILPGVTIGANAVIGAGSVVTKSVPARSVAAGNPARVIREIS